MGLLDALYLQRGILDGETVVLVATLAALRVNDTEGRRVYEQNGVLAHHFEGLASAQLSGLDCWEDGTPIQSLANVLKLRRPVVIMDEAHNARTPLTFETLLRFGPSAIIEFTATPETEHRPEQERFASNVLTQVSAAELKAEDMIKLPIKLWTRPAWTDAVTDAIARQRELERLALEERALTGERIRPIVLFQAQPLRREGEPVTADRLRQSLIEDHRIPEEQIATATGAVRGLDDVDLMDPACPVRFVITVQALREGWDCPWAYVLCSLAEQHSTRAVEQVLGRILRLPGARRKRIEVLNQAYAFVVSQDFAAAASGLKDALVENGFARFEADQVVEPGSEQQPTLFYATAESPVRSRTSEPPDLVGMRSLGSSVEYDVATGTLTLSAPLSVEQEDTLASCFRTPEARAEARRLARQSREGELTLERPQQAPSARPLLVPQLAIRREGALELFEESHFLDFPWRLGDQTAELSEVEFPSEATVGAEGVVDVNRAGEIQIAFAQTVVQQLAFLEGEGGWTKTSLALWLDRGIPHPDLVQADVQLFLHRAIEGVLLRPGVTVARLAHEKYRLRATLTKKIQFYRHAQHRQSFQQVLFEGALGTIEVGPEIVMEIGEDNRYAPNWVYEGAYQFRRHLFRHVGELQSEGLEFECAVFLDQHPLVDRWVRNISRGHTSFWLQSATDRIYPDFVGRLEDGRYFAVEAKGEHLYTADDAREKRAVGELWEERSGGSCVFVMPRDRDWAAIEAAFRG